MMDSNSIVDLLKSIGQDSSFQNRKRIWSSLSQEKYTGSQKQNDMLRQSMLSQQSLPSLFSVPWQPQVMPQDPRTIGQGRSKADILRDMIDAVRLLAQKNPKDPMIGMYQQFIRSKIGQMESELPQ